MRIPTRNPGPAVIAAAICALAALLSGIVAVAPVGGAALAPSGDLAAGPTAAVRAQEREGEPEIQSSEVAPNAQELEEEVKAPEPAFSGLRPDSVSWIAISFADGRPPLTVRAWRKLGTLYLADSEISAAFGISIKWDPVLRLMAMSGRKGKASAVVGGTAAIVDDRVLNLPHPFLSEAGRIMVPMSFLILGLPAVSNVSVVWNEETGELLSSSGEPTVSEVMLGGRPGLARVTIATHRPLAYRVTEGREELRITLKGAVAESTFAVKGTSMSPLRDCLVEWKDERLTLRLPLAGSARAFQTFREEYPQAIVLAVSTVPYREGYDLEPLARTFSGRARGRSVVLDPAHGGDELGAVGEGGVFEKDVVLDICKKASSILKRRLGINVYLTRDADHRVPPAGRAELANSRGAAVFVSVHCDSWPGVGRRGYGAFASPEPAVEGGYWTPRAERSASVGSIESSQGIPMKPWHKAQGRFVDESQRLASAIVGEMARVHDGPAMGIRRIKLLSLAGVDAPAVAVRCGFLSNEDDLRLLSGSESKDRLAAALARGIEVYLEERRP